MAENLKHKTKKGIYWTFFNSFCNNGLSFIVGVIMARLLSPSDYGITALPAVFIVVANVFITGGFDSAMIRKKELTEADLSTAFIYSASVGLFAYFLIFIGAPWIAAFFKEPILTPLVRVTALTFLWSPLATPQTILLNRRLDFKTQARIAIVTKIIGASIGITMAYVGYGLWALVIMSVVSSFLQFIQMWIAVKWKPSLKWSKDSFRYLWGFGNKLMFSRLLDVVYQNITPIFVGKYYSTSELGIYNRAHGYAQLPSQQGTYVIQQVTFPVLSKMQDDEEALARNYRKMLKVSAFVIFPVMTLLAALAKPLIIILVTEKWIESVIYLQLLCFSMMWWPIHSINLNLLQVKGRSDLFLKLEFWKKGIGLTIMALTLPVGLVYFVAAGILNSFITLIINTYYTGKLINVGFLKQMKDVFPTYFLSLVAFVLAFGVVHLFDNNWAQLIVGGLAGAGFYLGGAVLFKMPELQDVRYMIGRK